jgi:hypothetical protein
MSRSTSRGTGAMTAGVGPAVPLDEQTLWFRRATCSRSPPAGYRTGRKPALPPNPARWSRRRIGPPSLPGQALPDAGNPDTTRSIGDELSLCCRVWLAVQGTISPARPISALRRGLGLVALQRRQGLAGRPRIKTAVSSSVRSRCMNPNARVIRCSSHGGR